MQEPYYDELQDRLAEGLSDDLPESNRQSVRARVSAEFDRLKSSGLLDVLTADEVALLRDYRDWKATPAAAGGVFHWRKRAEA